MFSHDYELPESVSESVISMVFRGRWPMRAQANFVNARDVLADRSQPNL
jgi:hypothetical protein